MVSERTLQLAREAADDLRRRGDAERAGAIEELVSTIATTTITTTTTNSGGGADRAKGPPTLEELRARRDEIVEIAARCGARNVRVFGSVARGDAGPGSDVDFLVDLEPGRSLFDLSELILDLRGALGRKVDVVEITRPSPVAERIQREAVPL